MADEVGWGVLGAAWIAGKAVLPAIAASSNGRLVALASRSRGRGEAMLAPYPGARLAASYDAVLEDREVDAVYIPLVNSLHREWTLRALEAGKHVLCEKPLAMNATEAEEMATAASRARCRLMEAFMYRFDPRLRDFIDGISDPLHLRASFGFRLDSADNYRFQAALGGGALLDVGCYTAGIARWIMGEPVEVLARARMRDGIDVTVSALLLFAEGRTASLWSSFESPEEQEVTVIGHEVTYRRDRPFTPSENPDEPYRLMVESFCESVLHGRPAAIPPSESVANMRVLDRIREAIRS